MSRYFRAVFLAAIIGITSLGGQKVLSCLGEGDQCVSTGGEVFSTTSGALSIKLSDIPVGKVIQVGELKFVKVGEDKYLSISPQCPDPVLKTTGSQKLLTYTGNYQSYMFYAGCEYQIELWGASGNSGWYGYAMTEYGRGSYTSGIMYLPSQQTLYFYLGGQPAAATSRQHKAGGWNGGGDGTLDGDGNDSGGGAGGATDVRTINGSWNDTTSLTSRIMVAAGGGGASNSYNKGTTANHGGGVYNNGVLYSFSSTTLTVTATQTDGNKFGVGYQSTDGTPYADAVGGSGGGWWGGKHGFYSNRGSHGVGGSSYISGHTGCVAIASIGSTTAKSGCSTGNTNNSCSLSPTGLSFADTIMIDGRGYAWTNSQGNLKLMPNPTGGNYASGVGHSGNGYARITRLN